MSELLRIGVDLSKSVMHVQAGDRRGRLLWRRKVSRTKFSELLQELPESTLVYMEACQGAHFWSRKAALCGLKARQISPRFVRPFVKSQKNDYNDAEAVLEAGSRPTMRYVPTKNVSQQELQALHRIRERQMRVRTALMNQIRGILAEQGVTIAEGPSRLKDYLGKRLLVEAELSITIRELVGELAAELRELESRIAATEGRLRARAKICPMVRRLLTIPGIGVLSATALAVASADPKEFKNGRHFAAWLGVVPRQVTTGGKPKLLGISKHGNQYVRTLLIHGARSVVRHALTKDDPHSLWIRKLHAVKGTNLTAVAVANKNARIAWTLMTSNAEYDPALPHAAFDIQ